MREPCTRREREIWEASDYLLTEVAEVKEVTGERIMAKLLELGYKKGCSNEIYKYRRTWWEARGISVSEARGLTNSSVAVSSFSDPIAKAVMLVQKELQEQAETQLQQQKEKFEQRLTGIAAELSHKVEQNKHLGESNKNLQDLVADLKAKLVSLEENYALEQKEKEQLAIKLSLLEQSHREYQSSIQIHIKNLVNEQQQDRKINKEQYEEFKRQQQSGFSIVQQAMEDNRIQYMLDKERLTTENEKMRKQILDQVMELGKAARNKEGLEFELLGLKEELQLVKQQLNI